MGEKKRHLNCKFVHGRARKKQNRSHTMKKQVNQGSDATRKQLKQAVMQQEVSSELYLPKNKSSGLTEFYHDDMFCTPRHVQSNCLLTMMKSIKKFYFLALSVRNATTKSQLILRPDQIIKAAVNYLKSCNRTH